MTLGRALLVVLVVALCATASARAAEDPVALEPPDALLDDAIDAPSTPATTAEPKKAPRADPDAAAAPPPPLDDGAGALPPADDGPPPTGLAPPLVALAQLPVALLAGAAFMSVPLASPLVAGVTTAFLGDALGQQRGTIVSSVLGSYAGLFACGAVPTLAALSLFGAGVGLSFLAVSGAVAVLGTSAAGSVLVLGFVFAYFGILALYVSPVLGVAAAAVGQAFGAVVGYAVSTVDKRPHDRRVRLPGVFAPLDPPPPAPRVDDDDGEEEDDGGEEDDEGEEDDALPPAPEPFLSLAY